MKLRAGDLVASRPSHARLALRPGFGTAPADDLDTYMFRVSPGELGLVIDIVYRGQHSDRHYVAFKDGIDTTATSEDLQLVAKASTSDDA